MIGVIIASMVWYIIYQNEQIENLSFRLMSIQYQNIELTSRCNVLESNITSVFEEFDIEIASLKNNYSIIEESYNNLQYIYNIQKYEITRLNELNIDIQTDFKLYISQYKQLKNDINSRLAFDGDLSHFIKPFDQNIIDIMYDVSGGLETWRSMSEFWSDSMLLYDWIIENIDYASDSPYPFLYSDPFESVRWFSQSVKYPNETLLDRAGDCEDQAILLESMLQAHNNFFTSWCISIQWEGGGHVGVGIPFNGGRLAILDPSGNYHSGSENSFSSEPVIQAIDNWMSIVSNQEMNVTSIFNNNEYIKFNNTTEFYTWFNMLYG